MSTYKILLSKNSVASTTDDNISLHDDSTAMPDTEVTCWVNDTVQVGQATVTDSGGCIMFDYDMPKESNCLSIVYNLHNNDGGTDFKNNKIIKSKEGQAIVFNSDYLHKGVSSKNIPVRYALNIVCRTDD